MADKQIPLRATHIQLRNFRCFDKFEFAIESPIVLFEGINGIGKTSLLEALHYACYLRSFRTHLPRTLIQFGHDAFFIKVMVENLFHGQSFTHEIQAGFSHGKRIVKVDGSAVGSYKQLMEHIRVVSLTEDDLALIKEGPLFRRTFLDQATLLTNPDYAQSIKEFRQVVDNRNALLRQESINGPTYQVLTEQLWLKSRTIQQERIKTLGMLADSVDEVVKAHFDNQFRLSFSYRPKKGDFDSFDAFMKKNETLKHEEQRFARSCFGAHLDDFVIHFQDKNSRNYASRGQQKLAVLLLKMAQVAHLAKIGSGAIFLLDDFMTDFDQDRSTRFIQALIDLQAQLVLTSPISGGILANQLSNQGAQIESLR